MHLFAVCVSAVLTLHYQLLHLSPALQTGPSLLGRQWVWAGRTTHRPLSYTRSLRGDNLSSERFPAVAVNNHNTNRPKYKHNLRWTVKWNSLLRPEDVWLILSYCSWICVWGEERGSINTLIKIIVAKRWYQLSGNKWELKTTGDSAGGKNQVENLSGTRHPPKVKDKRSWLHDKTATRHYDHLLRTW